MKNGRLPTAEHILCKILENMYEDIKVGIAKFDNKGILEIYTKNNPRELNKEELENKVNSVISQNLVVKKYLVNREKTEIKSDKVPSNIKEIRIVEIENFDKRPCKDQHVDNTKEIGIFKIIKIKRVGKGRYRFEFDVIDF